jgi:oxalate decarboxylase
MDSANVRHLRPALACFVLGLPGRLSRCTRPTPAPPTTSVILDLEPGGLRKLHWHPNADEWQYIVDGEFSVSLFGSHGRYRVETLAKGDVAYIPQGYGHSIANLGSKTGRVLIGLNTGNYQAIDLSLWMASNPAYLLADHFGKPPAIFEKFPKGRAFISPPEGQGQREIK